MNEEVKEILDNLAKVTEKQKVIVDSFEKLEKEKSALEKSLYQQNQENKNAIKIRQMFKELEEGNSATEILGKHIFYSGKEKKLEVGDSTKKDSTALITAILAAFATICVAVITYFGNEKQIEVSKNQGESQLQITNRQAEAQVEQKKVELEIAKVERLEKLITSLSSKNSEEKKYATFAAISLKLNDSDFDRFVLSSLGDIKDKNILNSLLGRLKDRKDLRDELRSLSRYYSEQAEITHEEKRDEKTAYELAEFALKIYPWNAQANYRVARALQEDGNTLTDPLKNFINALTNLECNELNAHSKPDSKISIYERLGEYFYSINDETKAKNYFKEAKKILDEYQTKNKDDKIRNRKFERCIQSKQDCDKAQY